LVLFRKSSKRSELISGDTATGVVMKRRQQPLEDNCPRCKEPHEHLLHVLVRKDSDTGAFRKGLMEEFQIWLQKEKTEPNLERSLTLGLQSWIYDVMGREPSGRTFPKMGISGYNTS
jgi:hypothetical protein